MKLYRTTGKTAGAFLAVTLIVTCFIATFSSEAGAGFGPTTVAVLDFKDETGMTNGESLARTVTDVLTASLTESTTFQLVERSRIKKIVEEQALSLTGLIDTQEVADVGKMLAAHYLVIGSVSRYENDWFAASRLLEVKTGRIITAEMIEADGLSDLITKVKKTARKITKKVKHEKAAKKTVVLGFQMSPPAEGKRSISTETITRLTNVLRRKIENYGAVLEDIRPRGTDRIDVVVRQIGNPLELANILMSNDTLTFRLVHGELKPESPRDPGKYDYLTYTWPSHGEKKIYALSHKADLSGDHIKNASVAIDSRLGRVYISVEFDDEGTEQFARLTKNNVGRQLAIILNDEILMIPYIRTIIPDGRSSITGNFTLDEAFQLIVNLKSGILPVHISLTHMDIR
jgi:TolB-like protein